MNARDLIEADPYGLRYLTEAPLSWVWSQITNPDIPVGIISAFRQGIENEAQYLVNVKNTRALAAKIAAAGYGYFFVDGHWIENKDSAQEQSVKETSIFTAGGKNDNGKLKGLLKLWRAEYDQDAVLFKPEGTVDAYLLTATGEQKVGQFHPNRISHLMTHLRGRPGSFVFESASTSKNFWGRVLADSNAPS